MKTLVTGATGFVGRHLVNRLSETGHEIIATSTGRGEPRFPKNDRVAYIPCDLDDPDEKALRRFGEAEALIHAAWQGLPNYGELFHLERNLWSSYRFLKRMIEDGVRNITVVGTCFEYGKQEGCLSETLPPKPNTLYAVSKNALRDFLEASQTKIPFSLKWVRLFYPYGEGQNPNSILEQLKAAVRRGDEAFDMSGGEQLRDYLPMETAADYIVRIALQDAVHGTINCGSGRPISIRRLVEEHLKKTETSIRLNLGRYPYNPNEPMAFWADVEKLNSIGVEQ